MEEIEACYRDTKGSKDAGSQERRIREDDKNHSHCKFFSKWFGCGDDGNE